MTLVLVMRDDFYPQLAAQAHDLLAAVTTVDLPASLSIEQLHDIITKPATTAGLGWDTGLPEQIVTDVLADYDTAAARSVPITVLPLVQLTLYQLWQRRAGSRLTHDAYRQVGVIRGAVTTWCTAAIDQFLPAEQRCAEQGVDHAGASRRHRTQRARGTPAGPGRRPARVGRPHRPYRARWRRPG